MFFLSFIKRPSLEFKDLHLQRMYITKNKTATVKTSQYNLRQQGKKIYLACISLSAHQYKETLPLCRPTCFQDLWCHVMLNEAAIFWRPIYLYIAQADTTIQRSASATSISGKFQFIKLNQKGAPGGSN